MTHVLDEVKKNIKYYDQLQWNAAVVQKALGVCYTPEASMESLVNDVKVFQKTHRLDADGILGPATWEAMQESLMTPKERAVKKVVDRVLVFESGGRYDALNLDGEFKGKFKNHVATGKIHIGLSAGLIQFTQDGGSLGKLLKLMANTDEAVFKAIVGETWVELLEVTNAKGSSGLQKYRAMSEAEQSNNANFPIRGPRVKPVKLGDKRLDLWEPEWQRVMKALLNHPKFKPCQWELALSLYLDPMRDFLKKNGLTSEKSVCIGFNLSVHRGASGAMNFMDNYFKSGRTESQILSAMARDDKRVFAIVSDKDFTYNVWGGW